MMIKLRHQIDQQQFIRRIESFFFPPLCILCDTPRPSDNRWFCSSCSATIKKQITDRNACGRCGQNPSLRSCSCEYTWDYPFEKIIAFVDYTDTVRNIMRHIKYKGKRSLAYDLGVVCGSLIDHTHMSTYDVIIPVPLHKKRALQRGYNQAEYFARGLASVITYPEVNTTVLLRLRNTTSQTALDKSQRKENLNDAFSLSGNAKQYLHNKSVLLIDDVITTGATTSAATEVLLEGGCKKVTVCSFARD